MSEPMIEYDIKLTGEPGPDPKIKIDVVAVGMEALGDALTITHMIDALMMAACNSAKLFGHNREQFLENITNALPAYWDVGQKQPDVTEMRFVHTAPETKN